MGVINSLSNEIRAQGSAANEISSQGSATNEVMDGVISVTR